MNRNYNWRASNAPKCLERELENLEIRGRIEIIQTTALLNTQVSPGDLKRLAVTKTPVNSRVKKTSKRDTTGI